MIIYVSQVQEFIDRLILNSISIVDLLISLFVALIVGFYIFFIYKVSFRSTVYSYTFNMALVIIVILTMLIIQTVSSNNLVVTLGMLGTLGVVRFRSSLKEPLDIIYVLWASTAGFALGAMQYLIALLGSVIIGIILYLLSHFRILIKSYVVVVNYPKTIDKEVSEAVNTRLSKIKSKYIKDNQVELTLEVKNKYQQILDSLENIENIDSISLLSFED